MTMIDLATYAGLHPAAAQSLGLLDFFRPRLIQLIQELTPEQLSARPAGFSNDTATLCVHLAATEVQMAHAIMGQPIPDELKAEYLIDRRTETLPRAEGETAASLAAKLEKSRSYVESALGKVTDELMDQEFPIGPGRTATIRWAVGLIPLHLGLHFGHIQMLRKHI